MERAISGITSKLSSRKSTKDFSALAGGKEWPTDANQYQILDDCGRGVSATVHRAKCLTNGEIIAVKLMNLESMNCDLDEIIHEAQTMRMYNHPNILPLYTSFVHGQELWMVMPFVAGGSVLHIMKYAYPEGLDEVVIATIGREVLKGLDYVHRNGSIHRDVKAGNILVDGDGIVKLGDFGVAASLERGGSWGHDKQARMTFVGTPCWMAPEVMEQTMGYDFSADIWSFGITLLEMCHGHAPFAKFPPMKVLLMTLQNPAPTLEDKGKRHFSKALKDLVARCLQKESDKRPTAAQLLEHKFFKIARDSKYLKEFLVGNLPALADRVNRIRNGMAATNVTDNDRNLEKSQEEYRKGVSSWNFDLAALKAQAALEPDDDSSAHGAASMLPTISESDEREDTLTGTSAAAAQAFLVAQAEEQAAAAAGAGAGGTGAGSAAAAGEAARSFMSAFATVSGQESTARTGSVLPLAAPSPTPAPMTVDVSAPVAAPLRAVASGEGLAGGDRGAMPGYGDMPPPSPGGGVSPAAGLSREGSVGGNMGGMATTPTAVTKQKKGRFEVSEHPAVPVASAAAPHGVVASGSAVALPSLATTSVAGAPHMVSASSAGSLSTYNTFSGPSISGGTVPDLSALRGSATGLADMAGAGGGAALLGGAAAHGEEGLMMGAAAAVAPGPQPTLRTEVEESVTSVEPKQRGRFKIVAEQGAESRPLSKTSSLANLSDAGKSRSDGGGGALLGKPPTGPSGPSSITPPISIMLPKLQELLDHANAHQAALQKLLGAVQECDKGRVPLLLSRAQSTRSLFDGTPGMVLSPAAAGEGAEELRTAMAELRARLATLEDENARLRERNKVLETLHDASQQSAAVAASAGAPAPSGPSYNTSLGGTSVRFNLPDSSGGALQSPTLSVSPKLPAADLPPAPGSGAQPSAL
ncbi:hypothetical protein CHLRE_03g164900v5 [Chlamydomonas reinhardtii]|uniref:Protein kinase domain-containing protein n=1 Tax=Chlamydomonas reinhardtii TaxID=3055 RepID=A0A2K3DWM4_CHLRE|nr:uncharacterized protein CHLRE_03g164900v5 [Chlamydomonas reinhardtii]PNW84938.1 hypothetical protein CHLRE_03g164900v5 [Chlamydomonas reinhardtii]